jgi:menaquinol-cytochrome c reductase cytochrome b subunit
MRLLPGPLRRKNGNGDNSETGGNGQPEIPGALLVSRQRDEAVVKRGNGNGGQTTKEQKELQRERIKKGAAEVPISVVGWVDERTGAGPFLRGFLFRKTPKGTNWYYTLGSATMFAFLSQAVTGVFLAMYYRPSATEAYPSVQHITNDVFAGELVRGMHRWGATVMMVLIFLHMGRTFFFGAYKYPRELNWIIGVVLLLLTLMMALTGYLLPFDQRSFWATVVAVNINASGPIVGPYLADFLRGGAEFGATTISRFYAIHMLLVPGLIAALIGAHLYLVAKLGTTAPPWLKAEKKRELAKEEI